MMIGLRKTYVEFVKLESLSASTHKAIAHQFLGSARVSRVGERVSRSRTFLAMFETILSMEFSRKLVPARRRNQHARRVRYPDSCNRHSAPVPITFLR